jgi:N-acetylmuramoyl-L-alanine amidase
MTTRIFETRPLDIKDHLADKHHYKRGRNNHEPRLIIMHHTGGRDSRDWLSTASSPPVSAHRLISKQGVIYKILEDDHTAYTAGYGVVGPVDPDTNDPPGVASNLNLITLHIELENLGTGKDPYPDEQYESAAIQVAEWYGKYGYLAILGHKEVDPAKNDPAGFIWWKFYKFLDLALLTQRVEV